MKKKEIAFFNAAQVRKNLKAAIKDGGAYCWKSDAQERWCYVGTAHFVLKMTAAEYDTIAHPVFLRGPGRFWVYAGGEKDALDAEKLFEAHASTAELACASCFFRFRAKGGLEVEAFTSPERGGLFAAVDRQLSGMIGEAEGCQPYVHGELKPVYFAEYGKIRALILPVRIDRQPVLVAADTLAAALSKA